MAFVFPKQALASYPRSTIQKLSFSINSEFSLNNKGFITRIKQEDKQTSDNKKVKDKITKKSKKTAHITKCSKSDLALGVCKTFKVAVTGYSSTVDQCDADPFTTASGKHVHKGTLAANFLPFGTIVKFPEYFGDRVFIVEDRMNKRFSNRMDVWFESRREALQFGKRTLTAVVVSTKIRLFKN